MKCWCGGKVKDFTHPLYDECRDCGTLVSKKQMTDEDLKRFYGFDSYWHGCQIVHGHPTIEQRATRDFSDRIPAWYNMIKHKVQLESVLEIGCAHGGFLSYCRERGAKIVIGCEVDEETCKFVNKRFDLICVSGLFPDIILPVNKFDVVAGFDIVEHFREPLTAMRKIFDLLKDDGICVFQIPCYEGQLNFSHFRPEQHLFLYTLRSLYLLFEQSNLRITDLRNALWPGDVFINGEKK